jgi:hypothetical protein
MSRNSDSGGSTGKQLLHFLRTLFLPRFCDLLCACRYEEALQCLSTYYVDCTLDPRDGCNSNKQFVENLESPFILLESSVNSLPMRTRTAIDEAGFDLSQ